IGTEVHMPRSSHVLRFAVRPVDDRHIVSVMSVVMTEEAKRLLNAPEYAVLATVEPDGQPQLSVVWVAREDEDVLVSTVRGRRKELNLRRDSKVTILVYPADNPQEYLEVRGQAVLVDDPD